MDEAKANATNYELKLADDDAPHPSRYLLKVGVTLVGRLEDNDLVIDSAVRGIKFTFVFCVFDVLMFTAAYSQSAATTR